VRSGVRSGEGMEKNDVGEDCRGRDGGLIGVGGLSRGRNGRAVVRVRVRSIGFG